MTKYFLLFAICFCSIIFQAQVVEEKYVDEDVIEEVMIWPKQHKLIARYLIPEINDSLVSVNAEKQKPEVETWTDAFEFVADHFEFNKLGKTYPSNFSGFHDYKIIISESNDRVDIDLWKYALRRIDFEDIIMLVSDIIVLSDSLFFDDNAIISADTFMFKIPYLYGVYDKGQINKPNLDFIRNCQYTIPKNEIANMVYRSVSETPYITECKVAADSQTDKVIRSNCSGDKMREFFKKNISYPKAAIAKRVEGRVAIDFIIEADGTISEYTFSEQLGYGCDEEVLRALKIFNTQSKWVAGIKKGENVRVLKTASYIFKLKN